MFRFTRKELLILDGLSQSVFLKALMVNEYGVCLSFISFITCSVVTRE